MVALTPREIDTELARLWEQEQLAARRVGEMEDWIARHPSQATLYAKSLAEARDKVREVRTAAEPYEAEYRRRPWTRYFLVTNGNGHVHRGMNCSTCFPSTRYGWLPELSGCDEAAMVREYGERACTVCFPDAPSLYKLLGGKARVEAEQDARRAEREAKRAAKAAKAAANAITDVDGAVLKGTMWAIRTISAARSELVDAAGVVMKADRIPNQDWVEENRAAFERIAQAMAAKTGTDVETIKAEAERKARRRGY